MKDARLPKRVATLNVTSPQRMDGALDDGRVFIFRARQDYVGLSVAATLEEAETARDVAGEDLDAEGMDIHVAEMRLTRLLQQALMVSRDPDGLRCYSDHVHDIEYKGYCEMCGSDDVDVIGHVLPDVKRTNDMNPIDAARHVISTGSALMVKGTLLDLFSASAVVQVYDALQKEETREKFRSMTLVRAVTISFKLLDGQGGKA